MGQLLVELKKHVTIEDEKVVKHFEASLKVHHFFRERESLLESEEGRLKMLTELSSIDHVLESSAQITNGMRIAFEQALDPKHRSRGTRPPWINSSWTKAPTPPPRVAVVTIGAKPICNHFRVCE